MDAPQFLHSRASSSFSVPHFVQYTNLVHNQNKGCVIQSFPLLNTSYRENKVILLTV